MAATNVGEVQSQSYMANTRYGHGFVVTGPHGELLFSVTYPDPDQAKRAREQMIHALENAVELIGQGRP